MYLILRNLFIDFIDFRKCNGTLAQADEILSHLNSCGPLPSNAEVFDFDLYTKRNFIILY